MLFTDISDLKKTLNNRSAIVVIGAGAVGLYTANELVKRGKTVILIESGSNDLGGFEPQSFVSIGVKHDGISSGRSRTLGGTTNLWGGQLVEFQPVDLQGREWMPRSMWPITYEEIAAYYSATYTNLGINRQAQDDSLVWKSVAGGCPDIGEELEVFLTRWLRVPNFATYYAEPITHNPSLLVLTGHTAVGFEGRDDVITAVKLATATKSVESLSGECFVLSSGTIEIVRLLLHCIGDPSWTCPWRANRNVGAYFMDHIGGRIGYLVPNQRKVFYNAFCSIIWSGMKFAPKIRFKNEVLERQKLLNIQGFFAFESSISENMVYLKQFVKAAIFSRRISGLSAFFRHALACGRYLVPLMWRYVVDHRIFVPSTSKTSFYVQAEQAPMRESCITIDESHRDENGLPRVVLDWRLAEDQIEAIREFGVRVDEALHEAGLARLEMLEGLAKRDPAFITQLRDTNHQSGGAVMGFSAEDGVVDRDLRVFGTRNLYVAGSATFRTISNANTTFMALTLATRLVEQLTSRADPAKDEALEP